MNRTPIRHSKELGALILTERAADFDFPLDEIQPPLLRLTLRTILRMSFRVA